MLEADSIQPDTHWPWVVAIVAMLTGGIKAKLLFNRSCRKNLARIAALDHPKIWQFFRPLFFVFLFLMILFGATLSNLAHGDYIYLLAVAALDIAIAVALLGSGHVFWKK